MKKFISILLIIIFSIHSNLSIAGTDGNNELTSKKNTNAKDVKDCFEKLNRGVFAFNQGLDKILFKQFPVVDSQQKVVGLYTNQELMKNRFPNTVVLMAGGLLKPNNFQYKLFPDLLAFLNSLNKGPLGLMPFAKSQILF
mgnify:CR=1 FL=1